jgi:Spy/CpxP family protein refolding chaperone
MNASNLTPENVSSRAPRRGWRKWSWAVLAVPLMLGGVTYQAAYAHGGGPGGGGPGMHERMQARMDRILTDVGATDAQKAQIKSIWAGLGPQLKAAHQERARLHGQIEQAMTAATIDTAAIEKLRQQSVQTIDRVSTLFTQGMVQTAQALTPDQRQKALAELRRHPHHHMDAE